MTKDLYDKLMVFGNDREPFLAHNFMRTTDLDDGTATVTLRTGDGRYETTFPVVDGHPKPDASNHVEVIENYHGNDAALLIWHAPSGEDIELQLVNL